MEVQWTGKIWRYSGLVKYGGTEEAMTGVKILKYTCAKKGL